MLAPAGAPASRLKVLVLAGRSASEATAVKVSVAFSLMVLLEIGFNAGARFTSFTVTVKVLASLKFGSALSVTRTVIE